MTEGVDLTQAAATGSREHVVWRRLVAFQLVVLAIIVLSLLVVVLMGAFTALFAQRAL